MGAIVGDLNRESMPPPPVLLPLPLPAQLPPLPPLLGAGLLPPAYPLPPGLTYDKEEELKLKAAAWFTSRKNSYLRKLAKHAKMEYAIKAATVACLQSRPRWSTPPGLVPRTAGMAGAFLGLPGGLNPGQQRSFAANASGNSSLTSTQCRCCHSNGGVGPTGWG